MKEQWQRPQILALDALDAGLGDCQEGGTAAAMQCATGGDTGTPHRCAFGGYASTQYGGCDGGCSVANYCTFGGEGLHPAA